MAATRFLIAKFTPDLRRMEPRNFGVIVWSDGQFASKFAGEETTPTGKTRVRPPSHLQVESTDAYRQWIDYWRTLMSRPTIVSRRGEVIPRENVDFLENLRNKSREQFALVDGGQLLEAIQPHELQEVVDELFAELVAVPSERDKTHAIAAIQLRKATTRSLKEAGLSDRDDFYEKYSCVCRIGDVSEGFEFDFAIHAQSPSAVIQKVPLWKPDAVHSTAFGFQCVQQHFSLPATRCTSLVYATETDLADNATRQRLAVMKQFSQVLNLAGDIDAVAELKSLVS